MNNAVFIGRLGKDAELKTLDSGKQVINFSMAVDDGKDKPPIWIDCARWTEKTGVLPYLKKGTQVAVQGNVGLRKWDGGATITLRVGDLKLIGGEKPQGGDPGVDPASYSQTNKEPRTVGAEPPPEDLPF